MKKIYITPETFCTKIVAESMLASSQIGVKSGSYIDNEGDILVRESETSGDFWD